MGKVLITEVVLSPVCLLSIFIENQLNAGPWLNPLLSILFHYSVFSGFCCCCCCFVERLCWFGDSSFFVAVAVVAIVVEVK